VGELDDHGPQVRRPQMIDLGIPRVRPVPAQHLGVPLRRRNLITVRADGLIGKGRHVRHQAALVRVGGERIGEAAGSGDEPGSGMMGEQAGEARRPMPGGEKRST
jgi:hypothetical protein